MGLPTTEMGDKMSKYITAYFSMVILNMMIRVTWPEEKAWKYFTKAVAVNFLVGYLFKIYA